MEINMHAKHGEATAQERRWKVNSGVHEALGRFYYASLSLFFLDNNHLSTDSLIFF